MSAVLLDAIVHESGVGANVHPGTVGYQHVPDLRVCAQTSYGLSPPPTRPPRLSLETSPDGETWTTILDLGTVGYDEPVSGTCELPASGQLRARWDVDTLPDSRHWAPRIWIGSTLAAGH